MRGENDNHSHLGFKKIALPYFTEFQIIGQGNPTPLKIDQLFII